ncbi:unnamed protein product [Closterium sp. NIES-54]
MPHMPLPLPLCLPPHLPIPCLSLPLLLCPSLSPSLPSLPTPPAGGHAQAAGGHGLGRGAQREDCTGLCWRRHQSGAAEVAAEDDVVIIMAPQNAVGNCILDDLQAMVEAAAPRPVIILNPRLKDLPSAAGVMQVAGRAERVAFTDTFELCYLMRLLYLSGTQYPILGALRMRYPAPFEVYKRVDVSFGVERYDLMASLPSLPTSADISDAFAGITPRSQTQPEGIWGWLAKVF